MPNAQEVVYKTDLSGKVYGRLTVLKLSHTINYRYYWLCRCSCGTEKAIDSHALTYGKTISCGCYRNERSSRDCISTFSAYTKSRRSRDRFSVLSPVIYTQYKSKCRRRGLTFNLDKDYFIKLLKDNCAYCGNPPSNVLKASEYTGTALYNGIDRVDNSRGYEIDNVVACCETCNRAKLKMTKEEFLSWIDRVYRHQHDI